MNYAVEYLTHDYLIQIFSFLSLKELVQVSYVCKKWHAISSDDRLWKKWQLDETSIIYTQYKSFIVSKIKHEAIPALNRIKDVTSNLPNYGSFFVPTHCSSDKHWGTIVCVPRYEISSYTDFKTVNSSEKVWRLFVAVANAFEVYVRYSRIGYTSLSQAEALAIRTSETFHNPYPFRVLEAEYQKVGNATKAAEMRLIANAFSNI